MPERVQKTHLDLEEGPPTRDRVVRRTNAATRTTVASTTIALSIDSPIRTPRPDPTLLATSDSTRRLRIETTAAHAPDRDSPARADLDPVLLAETETTIQAAEGRKPGTPPGATRESATPRPPNAKCSQQ